MQARVPSGLIEMLGAQEFRSNDQLFDLGSDSSNWMGPFVSVLLLDQAIVAKVGSTGHTALQRRHDIRRKPHKEILNVPKTWN
jgi:hypothetical protein